MDDYESNCHTLRVLFGSCLSEINQCLPFWHYVVLLPKEENSSLSSLLNMSMDDLKQVLLFCGLIYYQRGTVKSDLKAWPSLMMENHIDEHYFDRYCVSRLTSNKKMTYFIGIGTKRICRLNPSSQFVSNSYTRKSSTLSNYLKKKCDRMKMLLKINNMIQNEVVDTSKVINK